MTPEEQIALAKSLMGKLVRATHDEEAAIRVGANISDRQTKVGIVVNWFPTDTGSAQERVLIQVRTSDGDIEQMSIRTRKFEIAEG